MVQDYCCPPLCVIQAYTCGQSVRIHGYPRVVETLLVLCDIFSFVPSILGASVPHAVWTPARITGEKGRHYWRLIASFRHSRICRHRICSRRTMARTCRSPCW
ncbi:unnamed protein product [Ectocarpus sp. 12 AP-2014]